MPLPNELVDSIIEELYEDDDYPDDMLLVRLKIVPSLEELGFAIRSVEFSISFEPYTKGFSLKRWVQLISSFDSNPSLASYVKRLNLILFSNLRSNEKFDWDELQSHVAAVVTRLSDVDRIWLYEFDWKMASPVLKKALFGVFRSPSLSRASFYQFHIDGFAEFESLLNMTRLKSLES